MSKGWHRFFVLPPSWTGRTRGAAWLVLAFLSAALAMHAYLNPRPPADAVAAKEPGEIPAVAPGLQKEIAALGAQSQSLTRQNQEARNRIAALEERLSSITGSLPLSPLASQSPRITSTEFGVELASATDIGEIDAVWQAMRQLYADDLQRLSAAIRVAGTARSRELVLIAGPLANARDAARICAVLRAGGQSCREVPFAGDMIPLGDTPPGKTAN